VPRNKRQNTLRKPHTADTPADIVTTHRSLGTAATLMQPPATAPRSRTVSELRRIPKEPYDVQAVRRRSDQVHSPLLNIVSTNARLRQKATYVMQALEPTGEQGGQQSTNEQSGRKIGRLLTSAGL
jgi:hypothetical protein